MIVKIRNKRKCWERRTHCVSALMIQEHIESPVEGEDGREGYLMIYYFDNGTDMTVPLSKDDEIYYMNDNGKTIDRYFLEKDN